jgi:hypothetical protein
VNISGSYWKNPSSKRSATFYAEKRIHHSSDVQQCVTQNDDFLIASLSGGPSLGIQKN